MALIAGSIIGGSLLGGLFGKSGQSSANKANIKMSREQQAFQERMSNTAHTRQAKDLENAGLNRILGISQSGASTPPGSKPEIKNELEPLANSAINVAQQIGQLKLMKAQTAKTNAETVNTVNASKKTGVEASIWEKVAGVPEKVMKHGQTTATAILDQIFDDVQLNAAPKGNSKKKRKYLEIDIKKHSKHYAPKRTRP